MYSQSQGKQKTHNKRAVGKLVLMAFYFLLRVGQYTHHSTKQRTQQYWLGDMKFFFF